MSFFCHTHGDTSGWHVLFLVAFTSVCMCLNCLPLSEKRTPCTWAQHSVPSPHERWGDFTILSSRHHSCGAQLHLDALFSQDNVGVSRSLLYQDQFWHCSIGSQCLLEALIASTWKYRGRGPKRRGCVRNYILKKSLSDVHQNSCISTQDLEAISLASPEFDGMICMNVSRCEYMQFVIFYWLLECHVLWL